MDASEKLLLQSKVSAVVLGCRDQFVLVPLDGLLPQASLDLAKARGYSYAGVVCVVNDQVEIEGPERELLLRAAVPFAEYVVAKRTATDDSVTWCESRRRLEDPRN
jgi:hypothetical protein